MASGNVGFGGKLKIKVHRAQPWYVRLLSKIRRVFKWQSQSRI
jgi:hypothetical protein